ncbi:hypothetical protein B0H17DRAFT_1133075 [Mycena rosella]|uniref:Uncharacterized protein n=1 Tax=Mycena rosella TaxID=1033263 RepID=A0AAD7DIS4_MYCRO|nr:hypothetical protein B0H17DRAFT_1133075 [Mycena rosella]
MEREREEMMIQLYKYEVERKKKQETRKEPVRKHTRTENQPCPHSHATDADRGPRGVMREGTCKGGESGGAGSTRGGVATIRHAARPRLPRSQITAKVAELYELEKKPENQLDKILVQRECVHSSHGVQLSYRRGKTGRSLRQYNRVWMAVGDWGILGISTASRCHLSWYWKGRSAGDREASPRQGCPDISKP